ncbi:MAG: right-handed parallel beta-helix repeat-containing protein, partial [Ignavibacteria bacterium]|nr:right-handed parallel beta-helix repeat-containing protein [Ignavibacteria bacterium]
MAHKNIFIICILFFSFYGFSATDKCGVISKNERWTVENSPYIISDDLLIAENARVIITPGVEILIGKPVSFIPGIPQIDRLDSFAVSIKVNGALKCVGRADSRIIFSSQYASLEQCQWYGIILNTERSNEIEIAYTDISNACNGITISRGSPIIRNCILEYNNIGTACTDESSPKIFNCIIANNFTAGILVKKANPVIWNNIIGYNKNNGIWSDRLSLVTIEYNCIFGNTDANLSGCNPELGINKRVNKNKDSTDFAHNLYTDPIFAG